jgi:hypothetical protein
MQVLYTSSQAHDVCGDKDKKVKQDALDPSNAFQMQQQPA